MPRSLCSWETGEQSHSLRANQPEQAQQVPVLLSPFLTANLEAEEAGGREKKKKKGEGEEKWIPADLLFLSCCFAFLAPSGITEDNVGNLTWRACPGSVC